jgi:hypothetical protein
MLLFLCASLTCLGSSLGFTANPLPIPFYTLPGKWQLFHELESQSHCVSNMQRYVFTPNLLA